MKALRVILSIIIVALGLWAALEQFRQQSFHQVFVELKPQHTTSLSTWERRDQIADEISRKLKKHSASISESGWRLKVDTENLAALQSWTQSIDEREAAYHQKLLAEFGQLKAMKLKDLKLAKQQIQSINQDIISLSSAAPKANIEVKPWEPMESQASVTEENTSSNTQRGLTASENVISKADQNLSKNEASLEEEISASENIVIEEPPPINTLDSDNISITTSSSANAIASDNFSKIEPALSGNLTTVRSISNIKLSSITSGNTIGSNINMDFTASDNSTLDAVISGNENLGEEPILELSSLEDASAEEETKADSESKPEPFELSKSSGLVEDVISTFSDNTFESMTSSENLNFAASENLLVTELPIDPHELKLDGLHDGIDQLSQMLSEHRQELHEQNRVNQSWNMKSQAHSFRWIQHRLEGVEDRFSQLMNQQSQTQMLQRHQLERKKVEKENVLLQIEAQIPAEPQPIEVKLESSKIQAPWTELRHGYSWILLSLAFCFGLNLIWEAAVQRQRA